MFRSRRSRAATAVLLVHAACLPAPIGAGALLHPGRRPVATIPSLAHRDVAVEGGGVVLRGWLFPASAPSAGVTVVYLHGVGDNRASGTWIAEKLVRRGFDLLTYDSRAHGASSGDACTYGFHEKRDLSRALDQLGIARAVVVGTSLGAAVALQAAAEDPRIVGVVSVATFSDLAAIARERAPFFATSGQIRRALELAEQQGGFRTAEVSPVGSAASVHVPVLVVHGGADTETSPDHSRRVFDALAGPKRLRVVDGAGHNDALGKVWPEVERFIVEVSGPPEQTLRGEPVEPRTDRAAVASPAPGPR
jgi:uncharacterized protein